MSAPKGNDFAVGNSGGGRPTMYKDEYAELAYNYCLLGAIDSELAGFFGVSETTINNWKNEHEDFSLALKKGKQIADAKVAQALFHRATGYSHEDVDIKVIEGEIVQTPLTKYYPPDATSAIFWLKNRQPTKWRDKQDIQHSGSISTMSDDDLEKRIAELTKAKND